MGRVQCLDGLRGLAALWVLVGHATILCHWHVPLISRPDHAVDLFMLLSGFLMTYHYQRRREKEPWQAPSTWFAFWTRRYFRIAPVYYLLLAVALLAGPVYGEWRDRIAAIFPATATDTARYLDRGWDNVFAHLSFVFGFSPHYSFRTVLPDWSIGLEMEFYLFFPLLMIGAQRIGLGAMAFLSSALCLALWLVVPDFLRGFAMPALLALKLHLFLAGMLLADAHTRPIGSAWRSVGAALLVGLLPLEDPWHPSGVMIRLAGIIAIAALVLDERLPRVAGLRAFCQRVSTALGARLGHFLGEMSYSVYLLHLLVMLPVAAFVDVCFSASDAGLLRTALCLLIVLPMTYGAAWLLSRSVEKWGIDLGHRAARRIPRRPLAPVPDSWSAGAPAPLMSRVDRP